MKTFSASAAALAISICIGGPAMAQGAFHNDRQHDRGAQSRSDRQDDRHSRRDDRREQRADRREDRRDVRRDERFDRRHERRHDAQIRPFYAPNHPPPRVVYGNPHGWRGAGPNHNFYRGSRLPQHYRNHYYVVNDWRGHRLSAPPRGYHWVQTGPDYVLAAIATGIILQVFLGG